jgi:hypothetical protein
MTIHDDGRDWEVSSGVRCISTDAHSEKCPARPPMDHFTRLLEEACPNHAYPVKHKLKDYDMMRSFWGPSHCVWGSMKSQMGTIQRHSLRKMPS